jgi:hypothetical protein
MAATAGSNNDLAGIGDSEIKKKAAGNKPARGSNMNVHTSGTLI